MKKILLLLVLALVSLCNVNAQTVVINTGTAGTPANNAGPIYRSSNSSTYNASRYSYLYTQSELASAGITTGCIINSVGWSKNNTTVANGAAIFRVFMKNSSATAFSAATETWSNLNTGATKVYENLAFTVPATAYPSYITFTLSTPFTYTGGSLEISTEWDINGVASPASSGSFDWMWSTVNSRIYGTGNTTLAPITSLSSTTNSISDITNRRPYIQISYTPGTPCTAPPTPGTATSSKANACSGENFTLNLTGNSSGSGQTYQWQQSTTGSAPWTNVGSANNSPSFSTTQTSSYYYRCEVTCTNSGLTSYSSSVQVTTPALVSGTFTIDKNGGGNFTSFADAINYIKCGINGAVTFNVTPGSGPYNEQIIVSEVYGASASNTITFNGNGETLTFSGGTVTNPNTLSLDGADYFVFNNLNIAATGATYGIAAHLYNAANYNKFSNCTFTSSITGTVSTQAAFVISGAAATVATAGNSGNGNIVDGCTMIGGYYSAVIYGNSTTPYTVDNQITNSIAKDFYTYGIYNVYGRNTIISHNIVERVNRTNPSAGYGIYLSTSSYNCTVDGNRVRKLFDGNLTSTSIAYCLYNGASGAAGFENKWTNNLVSDIRSKGTIYGMYCPTYNYVQIYHNTISLDEAAATGALATNGIYAYGNPVDIKNNIVTISRGGTGTKYCLYLSTSTTTTSDNNVLYMNAGAGTNYVAYRSSGYATLGAWKTATSLDMHSVSIDPQYSNPAIGNYLFTEGSINDIGTPVGILKDINGLDRSVSTPDPGAYETPPVAGLDISPQLIVSPTTVATGCYTNAETITIRIRNNSIDPIDFSVNPVTITVHVTGATTATYSTAVTLGTLASSATNDFTVSVPSPFINMTTAGTYNFEVIAQVAGDVDITNDTLTKSFTKIALTAGSAKATPDSYCVTGGKPTLSLTGATGYNSIQWQSSTTSNSGYTDIAGGTTLPYTVGSNIIQTMYYQAVLTCGTDNATSTEDTVILNNPQISTTTPATRCGPGTVTLNATGTGSEIKWYANPSAGTPLATGNSYSPNVNTTTTYYAASGNGSSITTIPGDGAWNHFTAIGAFQTTAITSAYMILTVLQPLTLSSMDIYPSATIGTSFSIEARTGSASGTTFLSYSGTTTVQNSATPTVAQTVPVNWVLPAGTYYIGFTTNPNTWRSGSVTHTFPWVAPGLASMDFNLTPSYQYYFYNLKLSTGCESGRTAVTATVTTPPAIDVSTSGPLNICTGGSSTLNVTSGNAGYTYTWTPGNMNGTGVVVNPGSTTKYIVNAVDGSGGPNDGCSAKDSVTVTINQPTIGSITPDYAFSCSGGGTALTVLNYSTIGNQTNTTAATGTGATLGPNALTRYYGGQKTQTLVLKSELNALGITGGSINKIALSMAAQSDVSFNAVKIKIGHTASSAFASTTDWKTGLTTVFTAATATVPSGAGWKEIPLSTPFVWNGTDNLVIEFIHNTNPYNGSTTNSAYYSTTGFVSTLFYRADSQTDVAIESFVGTASFSYSQRQNMQLGFSADGLNPVWAPLTGLYNDQGLSSPYSGTPTATVYAAPSTNTLYSVQGNDGMCNTNTLSRNVYAYSNGTWNGSKNTSWTDAGNWCGGVPTSSTAIIIPSTAPNQPAIASGAQQGASITFNNSTSLSVAAGASLTVGNAIFKPTTATLSGTGKLNVTNILTVQDGSTLTTGGVVVLKSDASKTARLAPVGAGIISGNVTVERYIPAKASRYWSLLSSPVTQSLQNSWQQQIHITGVGTGGTICPSLTAHTNGFDATATNVPSAYTYDASQAQGSRWQAVSNTNATNVGQGKGFRVNVRGPRSIGCDLLNGVNMVPSAATLSATGTLSNSDYNLGSFSVTYPNNGINNWVMVGNPYPSPLSYVDLQFDNGSKIDDAYAIYIPGNAAGTYSYWSDADGFFTGGTGYDNSKGNTIASGQAVFFKSTVAGSVSLDFNEAQKDVDGTAGYFRNNRRTINEKVKVSFGTTDKKIDEVVVRYANDATVSNTAIGKMDIPSMNYGTYITSLKGNQPMVVQTRSLNTLSTDEVWLNIGATQSGNYTFNFSDYENFAGTEIYLVDHLAKTTQNIKENATYVFSVDVNNAATKGSERFSLVFNRNVQPSVVYNTIKMYPNPANKQVTFLFPQSADISYNIKVTDMAGKIVLQHKAAGGTEQMSVDKLTTGTYIVEIIDNKGNRTTEKLIKN